MNPLRRVSEFERRSLLQSLLPAGRVPPTAPALRGDDEFTEADARAWSNLAPFRRAFGVHNVINAFHAQMPED